MYVNRTILLGCLAILTVTAFLAFKPVPVKVGYQHMIIYTEHYDLDRVTISIDGKEYKVQKFDKQVSGPFDFNPLINLIKQYENEGWELYSCQDHFYYLRKAKG